MRNSQRDVIQKNAPRLPLRDWAGCSLNELRLRVEAIDLSLASPFPADLPYLRILDSPNSLIPDKASVPVCFTIHWCRYSLNPAGPQTAEPALGASLQEPGSRSRSGRRAACLQPAFQTRRIPKTMTSTSGKMDQCPANQSRSRQIVHRGSRVISRDKSSTGACQIPMSSTRPDRLRRSRHPPMDQQDTAHRWIGTSTIHTDAAHRCLEAERVETSTAEQMDLTAGLHLP